MPRRSSEGSETAMSNANRPEERTVAPPPDEVYRALASPARRRILFHLLEDAQLTVQELLDVLAGERATREGGVVTPSDRESTEVSLVHADLPLLDEAGLVDYDERTVTLRDLDEFVATTIRRAYQYDLATTDG